MKKIARVVGPILVLGVLLALAAINMSTFDSSTSHQNSQSELGHYVARIDGVNIRQGPGTDFEKDPSGPLGKWERIIVLQDSTGWYRFRRSGDGPLWSGWVRKDLVMTMDEWDVAIREELRREPEKRERRVQAKYEIQADTHRDDLKALYDSGLLTKLDIENNEAWVEPTIWRALEYDTKEGIVIALSKVFDDAGSTGRVTVRDRYSGRKLASYSSWSGVTIKE